MPLLIVKAIQDLLRRRLIGKGRRRTQQGAKENDEKRSLDHVESSGPKRQFARRIIAQTGVAEKSVSYKRSVKHEGRPEPLPGTHALAGGRPCEGRALVAIFA
jgi:hypothetical protein